MEDSGSKESQQGGSLSERLRHVIRPVVEAVARGFIRLHIGPDLLTVIGLILSGVAGFLAAQGRFAWAALMIALGGLFDVADGAVARLSGRVSRFGALLDSTLDRYGEAFILTGLGYYLARCENWTGVVLTFVALFGSVMVSYTRARSEGLQIENKGGLLSRLERLVILVLALLIRQVIPGLWVLAILTHITVAQRMWNAFQQTRHERSRQA